MKRTSKPKLTHPPEAMEWPVFRCYWLGAGGHLDPRFTEDDARAYAERILRDVYEDFMRNVLAIPVLPGGKVYRVPPVQVPYQYLQSLPLLAQGTANKVFVIPAELSGALGAVSRAFAPGAGGGPAPWPAAAPTTGEQAAPAADADIVDADIVDEPPAAPGPA
jgi:hypothetical protein